MTLKGKISNSKCSCPAHRVYETHCKHVAALANWILERGSLLRSGVKGEYGIAEESGDDDSDGACLIQKQQQRIQGFRKLFLLQPMLKRAKFGIRKDIYRHTASLEGNHPDTGMVFTIPITLVEGSALREFAKRGEDDEKRPELVPGEAVLYVRGIFQNKVLTGISVESAIRYRDPVTHVFQVNTLTYLVRQSDPGVWKTTQGLLLHSLRRIKSPTKK